MKSTNITALKVMILEDQKVDQALVKRQVLKFESNSVFLVADNKKTFLEKIDWFLPDLILADYNLPDYTGLDALMYIKEHKPFIPFVFVTGGLNQSDPVADVVLKLADGFILKDHLSTLHEALKAIIHKASIRINQEKEAINSQHQQRLKILKATALLKESGDFSKKDTLLKLLDDLQNPS